MRLLRALVVQYLGRLSCSTCALRRRHTGGSTTKAGAGRRRMRRVRMRGRPARARSAPMKGDLRTWLLRSTIGAVDSARATSSLLRRSYHPEASVLGLRPRRLPLPPAVAARGHSLRPLYGSRARRPSRAYRTRAALPAFVSAACHRTDRPQASDSCGLLCGCRAPWGVPTTVAKWV